MSITNDLGDCVLDHIAIAVNDLDASIKIYEDLGLSFDETREVVESQSVTTAFASVDQNAHIELLEPIDDKGPIGDFIRKKGQGIHHICFQVKDVAAKSLELEQKGYKMIYQTPVEGAGNCLVNFVHPKTTGGVLIEISTKKG
jgi:methylmalonyl-CoA/ethylmalonyl-CoA epimerase